MKKLVLVVIVLLALSLLANALPPPPPPPIAHSTPLSPKTPDIQQNKSGSLANELKHLLPIVLLGILVAIAVLIVGGIIYTVWKKRPQASQLNEPMIQPE